MKLSIIFSAALSFFVALYVLDLSFLRLSPINSLESLTTKESKRLNSSTNALQLDGGSNHHKTPDTISRKATSAQRTNVSKNNDQLALMRLKKSSQQSKESTGRNISSVVDHPNVPTNAKLSVSVASSSSQPKGLSNDNNKTTTVHLHLKDATNWSNLIFQLSSVLPTESFRNERPTGLRLAFVGDSVTRYQALNLMYFLRYGKWQPDDQFPNMCRLTQTWNKWFEKTSYKLGQAKGKHLCDCYRTGESLPFKCFENRYFRDDSSTNNTNYQNDANFVYYINKMGSDPAQGRWWPSDISKWQKPYANMASRWDSPARWVYEDWDGVIRDHLAKLDPKPTHFIFNQGLHNFHDLRDEGTLLKIRKALQDTGIQGIYKTTTKRSFENTSKLLSHEKVACRLFPCLDLSWTFALDRPYYWDDGRHFFSHVNALFNQQLLQVIHSLPNNNSSNNKGSHVESNSSSSSNNIPDTSSLIRKSAHNMSTIVAASTKNRLSKIKKKNVQLLVNQKHSNWSSLVRRLPIPPESFRNPNKKAMLPSGLRLAFIGDSVLRYQALSLMYFLKYERWQPDDEVPNMSRMAQNWARWFNGTSHVLGQVKGKHRCDCFRNDDDATTMENKPFESFENRYFRDDVHKNFVYYIAKMKYDDPVQGRWWPSVVSKWKAPHAVTSSRRSSAARWIFEDWEKIISWHLAKLEPKPTHVLFNLGMHSNRLPKNEKKNFLEIERALLESGIQGIYVTTTKKSNDTTPDLLSHDQIGCELFPCLDLSWTYALVGSPFYWDDNDRHFVSHVNTLFNQQLLQLLHDQQLM